MSDATLKSVKVSGSGSVAGGEYDLVKGSGSIRIDGDVTAESIEMSGSLKSQGMVRSGSFRVSGSAAVDGDVDLSDGRASGSLKIGGNLRVDREAHISGSLTVGGTIAGESLRGSGSVRAGQEIALERLTWSGIVSCPGLVSADAFDLQLGGHAEIGELAGSTIQVRSTAETLGWLAWLQWSIQKQLTVGEISGDHILLESTEASVVRGDDIVIGKKCRVERVEYRDSLQVDAESWVGSRICVADGHE